MLDRLPGAAIGSLPAVSDPAWLGSQCWVRYTRMSSGMAVMTVLLLAAWVCCNQSANSLMADCLTFKVPALTDFSEYQLQLPGPDCTAL